MKAVLFSIFTLSLICTFGCSSSYKVLNAKQEDDFKLSNYATFGFYDIEATGDTMSENFEKNVGIIKSAIAQNMQTGFHVTWGSDDIPGKAKMWSSVNIGKGPL
jgi:hypothetical protein